MDNTREKNKKIGIRFASVYMKYGMIFILLVLIIVSGILNHNFLTNRNITNILRYISIVVLVAFGQTMVLILGKIDLSSGSIMALTGCITAMIVSSTGNLFLGIALGVLVGAFSGFINGYIIAVFKIPAFIMTLAMMTIARGIVLLITNAIPVSGMGNDFPFIGQGMISVLPMPVIIMIIFFAICWTILNRTKFGRYIYVCGGNEKAAVSSGISVKRTITVTYIIVGTMTAIAGIVLMSRINSGQPAGALGYEFDAITGAVVGGTSLMGGIGNIPGTFIGCLIVGIINNIMNLTGVSSYWQQITKGIIIATAVILDIQTKSILLNKR
jgi:inositol transport system permease protein